MEKFVTTVANHWKVACAKKVNKTGHLAQTAKELENEH